MFSKRNDEWSTEVAAITKDIFELAYKFSLRYAAIYNVAYAKDGLI